MVVKAKSDKSIGLMKNVKQFSSWQPPQLGNSKAPSFRQPVEEEEIVEETEEEKAQTLSDDIKAIKQAAFDEGFKAGQDKGFESGQGQVEQAKSQFNQIINQLAEPVKQCGEATQQQLLELAFSIARQIVRRELRQDPTQLIAIIREAIQLLPMSEQKIDLLLHPEDALMLIDTLSIDASSESSRWQIKQDPSIERGSCQVMTQDSKVDASLDKQIAVLFNRMVGGLRAGESADKGLAGTKADVNVNAEQASSEQASTKKASQEQTDPVQTGSEKIGSDKIDSEQVDSEQVDSNQSNDINDKAEINTDPNMKTNIEHNHNGSSDE